MMLLRSAVAEEARPRSAKLDAVAAPISHLLKLLGGHALDSPAEDPPLPPLEGLRQAGVPLAKEPTLEKTAAQRRDRRKRVLGFVREAGWSWNDGLSHAAQD